MPPVICVARPVSPGTMPSNCVFTEAIADYRQMKSGAADFLTNNIFVGDACSNVNE